MQAAKLSVWLSIGDKRPASQFTIPLQRSGQHKRSPSAQLPSWSSVQLRAARSREQLNDDHASAAIDLLEKTKPYEVGGYTGLWSACDRRRAYLKAKKGSEAGAEFQRVLDHRGIDATGFQYSSPGVRASALAGDKAKAAYHDFFALWKDADPDIPILKQAKTEYAKLQ